MKTLFRQTLKTLITAGACLLALGSSTANAQSLKLGHVAPPSHVWHQVAEKIATDLEKASGGKMKITVSPLQKLGNESQMINLLQSGAMQFGIFSAAGLSTREESFLAWLLPYTFDDVADATRAASIPAAREILKRLEAHGMVGLGYTFSGMHHVLSVEPVKSPKDLANKKIRVIPSPIYNDWANANGAAPTAMVLSEVAPSLITHLIDAVAIDLDALVGLKLHQQAPYLTMTHHMAFPGVIVVSKKWWDARSDADREMIRNVIAQAEAWGFQQAIAAERNNLEKAKADGIKVVEADIAAFQAVASKVRDKYIASNPLIADFYKQATTR